MSSDLDVLLVATKKAKPPTNKRSWWCRIFHRRYHVVISYTGAERIEMCGWCGW